MAASGVLWVLALCGLVVLNSAACPDATFNVEHTVECCDNAYNTGGLFGTPTCCRSDVDDQRCFCKSGASVVGEGCAAGTPEPAPTTTTATATTTTATNPTVTTTAADTTTVAATTTETTTGATTTTAATTNPATTTTAGAATTIATSTECQCFCGAAIVPTTTCGAVTTTKLCPEWPMVTARVLGGTPTDECTVDGVLQFSFNGREICNGVFVYDPTGPFPQEPAVYMPTFCKNTIDTVTLNGVAVEGSYNVITFDTVNGSDIIDEAAVTDNITALLTTPGLLETGSCQVPACVYNPTTMSTELDLNNCTISSFGFDNITTGVPTSSDSLNTVAVTQGTGCPPDAPAGTECFVPVDPDVYSCTGDTGAPVYCMLSTGESVLYGLVDVTPSCGRDQFFNIRPVRAGMV